MNVKKKIRFFLWSLIPVGVLLLVGGMFLYRLFGSSISIPEGGDSKKIWIPTQATFQQVLDRVAPYLEESQGFVWWSQVTGYDRHIRSGCYQIDNSRSVYDLVNLLRSGQQLEVSVSFNAHSSPKAILERIATQIEPTSDALWEAFLDEDFLREQGLDRQAIYALLIPNTYRVFWNISADKFRDRMLREYHTFWNPKRKASADRIGLSPLEVATLASIVERETVKYEEMPKVAGLYINRLNRDIKLQADPTVVYAIRRKMRCDTCVIRRVLLRDLKVESPFNTYKYKGLPPAPIGVPGIRSIDAVLNYQEHSYIFMCASIDRLGYHEFATNIREHNRNRKKYTRWLTKRRVFR